MTEDAELFVDLTDESREDGVRSFSLYEASKGLRRIQVVRPDADGSVLIEIIDRFDTIATICLSRGAMRKVVRALVRFEFVEKDWND